jgi:hypothetical protein
MNAYKGVILTTVEFNDSLSNQDYTELTTGQQADITAGKDVDNSEYNYGTILIRTGYKGSLKNLAGSCITSSHQVNKFFLCNYQSIHNKFHSGVPTKI